MNFELTKEQQMIQEMIRQFVQEKVAPTAVDRDRSGEFPQSLFRSLGELGLLGLPFAEEYGGSDADTTSFAIVVEELATACGSTALGYSAHVSLGAAPIAAFGTEIQKEKFLMPLCRGESLGAFGLTEPGAGSDAGATKTTAVWNNGEFSITGSKCYITNASFAKFITITAKIEGEEGISAFIIPTNAKGVTITTPYEKLGLHSSNTTEIYLEDVRVGEDALLGKRGEGFKQFLHTLDGGRIGIAALGVGLAEGAFRRALDYAKQRTQFGTSIGSFQAIKFKLADMAMQIEVARTMVYKAAWLKDQGRPYKREAAMAKLYASEMSVDVCDEAIQIHGGNGYMKEYEVERMWRDAKLLEIGEGTSEVQRMVIARSYGL
ncbi:acyl-CoA dehydrogenase family protein [Mangrovibacillus cuniculi]|uniref:Acyl-CoA dehydrogenase n=1 Tax=Mangrovibacillus cuniculi TaxID=2593652 RepID=A0A7S8HFH2_9BACI|nr:acyl-CoA dehydrogenase family protein [Mangrovibacillus cuniculi]QPC46909.1 acyl-CoA dehydrogenase [Mangrovibacillus cuniculi]